MLKLMLLMLLMSLCSCHTILFKMLFLCIGLLRLILEEEELRSQGFVFFHTSWVSLHLHLPPYFIFFLTSSTSSLFTSLCLFQCLFSVISLVCLSFHLTLYFQSIHRRLCIYRFTASLHQPVNRAETPPRWYTGGEESPLLAHRGAVCDGRLKEEGSLPSYGKLC